MDGEEKLTLCLRSDVHPHFNVRVKQKTPFSKVFQAFSQRYAAKPGCTFRYTLCDGTALGPDASPKTYGLEDEEIINVAEIPEGQPQGTQRVNQVNGTFREAIRDPNVPEDMQNNECLQLRVEDNMLFSKIIEKYENHCGLDRQLCRYIFEERRLHIEDTPKQYGMEDGSVVEVMLPANGGSI
eukprot:gb/GECG01008856.1/.p1 GENE.gb/GECG01008856.1/~~gb/GECG01008856.1/.p1  ORF type:complete len:183 (+),score=21.04 gb/GECG01008856.1/:1-549(+)